MPETPDLQGSDISNFYGHLYAHVNICIDFHTYTPQT